MLTNRRTLLTKFTGSLLALGASRLEALYADGDVPGMPRVYTPTRRRALRVRYPWRHQIVTTFFWIGEQPTPKNPTPNHASSWDPKWQSNYGGYDDPNP